MPRSPIAPLVAVVLTAGLGLLVGCGQASTTARYDDADVTFASEMVPHHEQAIEMAQLAENHEVDSRFAALARKIRAAQAPEIEKMTGWLEEWDMPAPSDASDSYDMDMGGEKMAGMMSSAQMHRLGEASGADFEQRWLELMIAHHEGALEMARTEIADGRFTPAVDLARHIEATQTSEIEQMKSMLSR